MSGYFFLLLPCFIKIPVFNANSVYPDQVPHSAASDLGLHCLPKSLLQALYFQRIPFLQSIFIGLEKSGFR